MNIKEIRYDDVKPLLLEAEKSTELFGFVSPDDVSKERFGIFSDEKVVGFFTPRKDNDGVWRMGAIYILPEFRKKGHAAKAIATFMEGRKGRAFIEDNNIASQMAYRKAGFTKSKLVSERNGAWYINFVEESD